MVREEKRKMSKATYFGFDCSGATIQLVTSEQAGLKAKTRQIDESQGESHEAIKV